MTVSWQSATAGSKDDELARGQLSNQIRVLRFMHGEMKPGRTGERIGVTRQTIAAIEVVDSPSLEAAFRIAAVFKVPLEQVFQWQSEG